MVYWSWRNLEEEEIRAKEEMREVFVAIITLKLVFGLTQIKNDGKI
jgi:hypothetical protein